MHDPVILLMRILLLAATALNLWSFVRCWHISNKNDLGKTVERCIEDETGEISFGRWMLIHHENEPIMQKDLLRMYSTWLEEGEISFPTRLINDGIVLSIIRNGRSAPEPDTPPDES